MMNQFFQDLGSLDARSKASLLNNYAIYNYNKQEIAFKLWTALRLDYKMMRSKLLFYGIDMGFIEKDAAFTVNEIVSIGTKNFCPAYLPEGDKENESEFEEDDWKLFRITRRNYSFNPQTTFICDDDIEKLKIEAGKTDIQLDILLNEAAYFGSIKCFNYLIIAGANPSMETMMNACCSGKEEMIQKLKEKGLHITEECLQLAIEFWNNKLAKWIIEEENLKASLHAHRTIFQCFCI